MKLKSFFYLLTVIVINNNRVLAQAGNLDSTFGTNGIIKWIYGVGNVSVQQDSNIILAGTIIDSPSTNNEFGAIRYTNNGILDNTFGINGWTETQVGQCCDQAANSIIQKDGKIVIAGYCVDNSGKGDYTLLRYTPNGKLDNTFNGNGIVLTSFNTGGYADYGFNVAIEPNGKIVQVGFGDDNSGSPHFGIARYDSTGIIDNTFGTNGKVLTSIMGLTYAAATCVIVRPDGKIIAGGGSSNGNAPNCFALAQYNVDGSLDNTFGTGGEVTTFFGSGGSNGNVYDDDEEYDMVLQPDGKIIMVGNSILGTDTINTYNSAIALARYDTDGLLDTSFGEGGKVRTKIPKYDYFLGYGVAIQSDGKVLVSGFASDSFEASYPTFILIRYQTNGLLDTTFGLKGVIVLLIDTFNSQGGNIVIQSDGKILVSGRVNNPYLNFFGGYNFIVRFLSGLNTGILNFSVKQNPILIYPNPIKLQATLQYTLSQNEQISIVLYDIRGRLVQTFISNQNRAQGEQKAQLDFSPTLSPGNYILSISNGIGKQTIEISLVH